MQKFILVILFLVMSINYICAQSFDDVIKKYRDNNQLIVMELTSDVMRMFASDYAQRRIIDKIDLVEVFMFDDTIHLTKEEINLIDSDLLQSDYALLINARDKVKSLHIYVKESDKQINGVVMILDMSEGKQILSRLTGELDFEDFQKLKLDFEGSEHLKKLGDIF